VIFYFSCPKHQLLISLILTRHSKHILSVSRFQIDMPAYYTENIYLFWQKQFKKELKSILNKVINMAINYNLASTTGAVSGQPGCVSAFFFHLPFVPTLPGECGAFSSAFTVAPKYSEQIQLTVRWFYHLTVPARHKNGPLPGIGNLKLKPQLCTKGQECKRQELGFQLTRATFKVHIFLNKIK
jgi:hypothetical protein